MSRLVLPDDVGTRGLAVGAESVGHDPHDVVARILPEISRDLVIEGGRVGVVQRDSREVVLQDVDGELAGVSRPDDAGRRARAPCALAAWLDDVAGTRPALPLAAGPQVGLSDGRILDQQPTVAVFGQRTENRDEG